MPVVKGCMTCHSF